jgi:hypothetical protein
VLKNKFKIEPTHSHQHQHINIKSTATMMSSGFFSTDSVSISTAPCSFTMHATNEETVSPSKTDLVIDYENSTVDLSNLVYTGKVTTKNSGLKKPAKNFRSLYPSTSKVNILQDGNNASYIFAKSRMEQQFRKKKQRLPRQDSMIRCRTKMAQDINTTYFVSPSRSLGRGASFKRNISTYSPDEARQENDELLPPGMNNGSMDDFIDAAVAAYIQGSSTAPCSFTMHGTNKEKVSPSQTWDLVIDYENSIVDLSNLVYSRRSLLSGKVPTKNSGLRKPAKNFRSLYPSKSKVNILQDGNNPSYIFAKSCMEQQFRPRGQLLPRQNSIIRCRSKMDQDSSNIFFASSSRSLGRGISFKRTLSSCSLDEACQDNEILPPGASDGTLSDSYDGYTTPNSIIEIEIAPGVFAPLRGGQETLDAIQEGNCVNVHCFCCAAKLLCIYDAQYVLCPDCNVVSLVDLAGKCDVGGVGLGLLAD